MDNKNICIKYSDQFIPHHDNSIKKLKIPLSELSVGINILDNYIIKMSQPSKVEWVISKVCDHANGTLQLCSDSNIAECPLHGWKLDLHKTHLTDVGFHHSAFPAF